MCLNLIVWFIPVNPRYPSGYYPHSVAISPSLQFKPELPNCWVPRCRFDQTHRLAASRVGRQAGPSFGKGVQIKFKLVKTVGSSFIQSFFFDLT